MIAAALCFSLPIAAQDAASVAGRRLVDLIAELREAGIAIIYSSELLTGEMRAEQEPAAESPVERLREILEPYGLALEAGPQSSWLVIRDPQQSVARPALDEPPSRPGFAIRPPTIEEIVVSASRYALSREVGSSTSQIDRLQLENTPTLGEDALRATHGLPGLTSSGFTSQINVRGGTSNEAQLLLDGIELFNPYHLKDFQSLFSSVAPNIVDSMTVYTGAFPAQFGNRMSAVIEMRTIEPTGPPVVELGASLFTSSFLSSGSFADGRGAWLSSLRRGNLDLLIEAGNPDLGSPGYMDAFGKVSYDLNAEWSFSAGLLALQDEITLNQSTIARADASYDDTYVWARADYGGANLSASYLMSVTKLQGERVGAIVDPVTSTGKLTDNRLFDSTALKADWTYLLDDDHLLSWGAELRRSSATYRYAASISDTLPISIAAPLLKTEANIAADASFDGDHRSLYVSYRTRLLPAVTAELGLRWDDQDYLNDDQTSPRVNVLFDLSERLRLRGSWGKYFQTQRLDELQINNGLNSFLPAQESEHYVLGLEYVLGDGTSLRLEAYRKEIEQLQPRSENLFARLTLLPELLPDRITIAPLKGESTGLELSADGERGRWRWWGSLTRARSYDLFTDSRLARSWEEPWSLKGGAIRMGDVWNLALTTTWHSGWPISTLSLVDDELVAGGFNGREFGEFGSVDLRLSREVRLERSELEWYVSVLNVFARDNPCCIDYDVGFNAAGLPASLVTETDYWLSVVPNVGILWRFAPGER